MIRMPVAPGRNLAILVEVAARNQLLRARGHHAARRLAERLNQQLETLATPGEPELEYGRISVRRDHPNGGRRALRDASAEPSGARSDGGEGSAVDGVCREGDRR